MNILQEYYQNKTVALNHLYSAKKIKEISKEYLNHVFYARSQGGKLYILYKGRCYKYSTVYNLNWVFDNIPVVSLPSITYYQIFNIREYFKQ